MSKDLRGECQQCGGPFNFPAESTGSTVACPHCGQCTELLPVFPPEPRTLIGTKAIVFTSIAIVVLVAGLGGAVLALKRAQRISLQQKAAAAKTGDQAPSKPIGPFAAAGFDASPVSLEKGQGSSLVYAVGTITNLTDRQRFGVRVELELLDASGNKIGSATDYRPTLESNTGWRFRALVVEKKTAAAKIVAIKEDK